MNCLTFRNSVLSEPYDLKEPQISHHMSCRSCTDYLEELMQMDKSIAKTLEQPSNTNFTNKIKAHAIASQPSSKPQAINRGRRLLMAASVAGALVIGGGIFTSDIQQRKKAEQFRQAAAQYIHQQPQLLEIVDIVEPTKLSRLVNAFGGELVGKLEGVSFAEACGLSPAAAAHLIIKGKYGPVTLMYSSEIKIKSKLPFQKYNMKALHYPLSKGSATIFGSQQEPLDEMIKKVGAAISW